MAGASSEIIPHGVIEESGWALARLNDGESPTTPEDCRYRFAETTRPVRLYLIDSAVDNTSGWFDGNPNLTFAQSLRLLGGGQPPQPYDPATESTSQAHATRMLSVIAGPEKGAARGTPIELYSYDIYSADPGSSASNLGLLLGAISRATVEHEIAKLFEPDLLGVVCIANGTGEPTRSPALLGAIDQAIGVGLVVVVSAGNESSDVLNGQPIDDVINGVADAHLPAAYGQSRDGLICVGASTPENTRSPLSNHGQAIDLHAPGVDVPAFDPAAPAAGQNSPMQGTSPAAALAAAAALAELSRQPELDPAGLENELKGRLHSAEVAVIQIDDDLDGDGAVDEIERFFGFSISDPASSPPAPSLSLGQDTAELAFTIAAPLWQPENPMQLADSSAWRLMASTDLVHWTEISTFVSYGSEQDGRIPVTAMMPKDFDLAIQQTPEDSAGPWVATEEQIKASQDLLRELFETQKDLFPDWYWEIIGLSNETSEKSLASLVAPAPPSQGVFYRIEVIPNP